MYSFGELFMRSLECYFGVYFLVAAQKNTKITLEWAHKPFVTRVHTLFYIYFIHMILISYCILLYCVMVHYIVPYEIASWKFNVSMIVLLFIAH